MGKRGWAAMLAVTTAACTPAETARGRDGAETGDRADAAAAPSASSTAPAPAYYPPGYAAMTEAAAIFARENFGNYLAESGELEPGAEPPTYAVEDCQSYFENAEIDEPADSRAQALEELAREIAKHRHYLSQFYPPAVFREPLAAYEKAMLRHFAEEPPAPPGTDFESPAQKRYDAWLSRQWAIKEAFANELEQRRRRLAPRAIAVDVGGGCGAGETPYLVGASGGGRVWMTTKFQWDLCRVRKFDPWDTKVCRWTEMTPDKEVYLSGRYVYQARWPDGKTRRDVRVFDGAQESEKAVQVTITKP